MITHLKCVQVYLLFQKAYKQNRKKNSNPISFLKSTSSSSSFTFAYFCDDEFLQCSEKKENETCSLSFSYKKSYVKIESIYLTFYLVLIQEKIIKCAKSKERKCQEKIEEISFTLHFFLRIFIFPRNIISSQPQKKFSLFTFTFILLRLFQIS